MSLKEYGVWTANAVKVSAETAEDDPHTPHIHLFYDDGTGGEYNNARRASINVKSSSAISELVVWVDLNFTHPITEALSQLENGYQPIARPETGTSNLALDYIRTNLMDFNEGKILPHDVPGAENDVLDLILPLLESAVQRNAVIHLFGEPYLPGRQGIHDIHMNQGSAGRFTKYNGTWQDGGLFIRNSDDSYTAIFIAFASQAIHTEETTGNALEGSGNFKQLLSGSNGQSIQDDMRIAIIGALVNPMGPENTPQHSGRPETVWVMNRSKEKIDLNGWTILNKSEIQQTITNEIQLLPGEIHSIEMTDAPLSNQGGVITLLDDNGIKVDGVSYTRNQAQQEGYVVVFR